MLTRVVQIGREPLFHFLLIGVAIYAFYGMFGDEGATDNPRIVTVTAGEIQSLADQWERVWSRAPTDRELAGVIKNHVRIQVLYREAIAMGLDKGDTVVERRMAQKLELLAESLITPSEPSDELLKEWYVANEDRYRSPDLYTITHIFFDPGKREDRTVAAARTILEELNAMSVLPLDYSEYGDRLMLQSVFVARSQRELDTQFGSGFAAQITEFEPGIWHGPVSSGYGMHLVLVNGVATAPQPVYDEIKERLKRDWMSEQVTELSERFIDGLISRYEIVIDETGISTTMSGGEATP